MNLSPSDDRSVETTSSEKSSNEYNEPDVVVVLAIVEVDGLFDDSGRDCMFTTTPSDISNSDTFITKIRIYQSELLVVVPPVELSGDNEVPNNNPHRTSYIYTARQLREKIQFQFAGKTTIPAASQKDANAINDGRFGNEDLDCYHIFIYNNATNGYTPLPEDDATNVIPLFGTRWRVRVIYRAEERLHGSSVKSPIPLLAIQGRYFAEDIHPDGTITVGDYNIQVLPPHPASTMDVYVNTGYHVWDGALLLIRYLESRCQSIFVRQSQCFLELGSGCGIVGIAATLLGAKSVMLTDLPELLPFLQSNVDANLKTIVSAREQQGTSLDFDITCESCDWTEPLPLPIQSKSYDVILIADCIWIESLVVPLFDTLRKLTENKANRQGNRPPVLIADLSKAASEVPGTIFEHEVIGSSDDVHFLVDSISHMDLGKSKTSLDESPVNSDADIYHQQSSQQLSGHVTFHDNEASNTTSMDQSLSQIQSECDSQRVIPASSLSLLEEQRLIEPEKNDPEIDPTHIDHRTTVLISYQRRGKSTHETFIRELKALFTVVEIVTVPNLDYPQDVFYLYSCRR